jgi:hypothetical protein
MPNRDNGFVARHYVPLADLDPRLADAMLDLLRDEGIAAYASPSTGRLGGYLEVILPERPRDRLWVDREQRDRAVGLLNAHADPESIGQITDDDAPPVAQGDLLDAPPDSRGESAPTTDESATSRSPEQLDAAPDGGQDDAWASVLASFEMPAYEPPGSDTRTADHPVPRRIVRPAERGGTETGRADDVTSAVVGGAAPLEAPSPVGWDPLELLDEHFVPPQPPPPPRLRTTTKWALAGILVGLVLLVWPHVSDSMPEGASALGVFLMIGGFVALIANMRDDRDSNDDDGAVV